MTISKDYPEEEDMRDYRMSVSSETQELRDMTREEYEEIFYYVDYDESDDYDEEFDDK